MERTGHDADGGEGDASCPLSRAEWTAPAANPPQETSSVASTLDGRLLCASECAYGIRSPYFRAAGYEAGTVAKRLSRSVNSVFVGRTVDGIAVSFRGTLPGSALDWFQNAALLLSPARGDGVVGQLHVGFYRAVKALWEPLKSVLLEMLKEPSGRSKDVYLTGHSKGGAMASVAALLMCNDSDLPDPTGVYTFGSARVGNSAFRDEYNSLIQQVTYENHLDLVPFLPPSNSVMEEMDDGTTEGVNKMLWSDKHEKQKGYVWGFQPLGKRKYITEEGTIVDGNNMDGQRIRDFEEKTMLQFQLFRAAHRSDCEGGYFRAIDPEVCALAQTVDS